MPIPTTLAHQFNILSTTASDDNPVGKSKNPRTSDFDAATVAAAAAAAVVVTPTKDDGLSSSLSVTSDEYDDEDDILVYNNNNNNYSNDDESPSTKGMVAGSGPATTPSSSTTLQKTEQRLREERGELVPEPLLLSNPHRFVIFPIQDNEVRFSNVVVWLLLFSSSRVESGWFWACSPRFFGCVDCVSFL
jgi:hypothetical protein